MNEAHLHLLLNHFPIIVTLVGFVVLIAGLLLRNNTVQRTALALLIGAAVCALPAYFTGDDAEHTLLNLHIEAVNHDVIEKHEDLARFFLWIMIAVGIAAGATFWLDSKSNIRAKTLYWITLALTALALLLATQVGSSGGDIRHKAEINAQ